MAYCYRINNELQCGTSNSSLGQAAKHHPITVTELNEKEHVIYRKDMSVGRGLYSG